MLIPLRASFLFLLAFATAPAAPRDESRYVWLDAPAQHLFESTPLGNGRLGASLYGGIAETDRKSVV